MTVRGLGCILYRMPLKEDEKKEKLIFGYGSGIEIDIAAGRAQNFSIYFYGNPDRDNYSFATYFSHNFSVTPNGIS